MKRILMTILMVMLFIFVIGCDNPTKENGVIGDDVTMVGDEGFECYPNQTCNEGLECVDGYCLKPNQTTEPDEDQTTEPDEDQTAEPDEDEIIEPDEDQTAEPDEEYKDPNEWYEDCRLPENGIDLTIFSCVNGEWWFFPPMKPNVETNRSTCRRFLNSHEDILSQELVSELKLLHEPATMYDYMRHIEGCPNYANGEPTDAPQCYKTPFYTNTDIPYWEYCECNDRNDTENTPLPEEFKHTHYMYYQSTWARVDMLTLSEERWTNNQFYAHGWRIDITTADRLYDDSSTSYIRNPVYGCWFHSDKLLEE